jgi:hypothetical protein
MAHFLLLIMGRLKVYAVVDIVTVERGELRGRREERRRGGRYEIRDWKGEMLVLEI